jgi:hypothetical protein
MPAVSILPVPCPTSWNGLRYWIDDDAKRRMARSDVLRDSNRNRLGGCGDAKKEDSRNKTEECRVA